MDRARRTMVTGFLLVVLMALGASSAAAATAPPKATTAGKARYFVTPTWGTLSSHLGWRRDPFRGNTWQHHWGIDIASRYGTPVLASAAGVVRFGAAYAGYGPLVYIEHGRGWATLYAHLSRIDVRVGQRVRQAQIVGAVGSLGRSTGPHLHFEIRYNGVPVNPLTYLGR